MAQAKDEGMVMAALALAYIFEGTVSVTASVLYPAIVGVGFIMAADDNEKRIIEKDEERRKLSELTLDYSEGSSKSLELKPDTIIKQK